mmetsp:Transcript_21401/g.21525  ORF Transcript_21401/g.21525 Transcript_21401/m.21525 type:complete len:114 (+) Transcript_21401:121-462(+)
MSGSNILTSMIMAPFLTVMSAISLATLQRALDWVTTTSKTPQKGFLRQIKPFLKNIDAFFERIMAGNKITVNTTNILLMTIVVAILVLVLTIRDDKMKRRKEEKAVSKASKGH